jgi:hypothetical protein
MWRLFARASRGRRGELGARAVADELSREDCQLVVL